jgi:hypothetical protein
MDNFGSRVHNPDDEKVYATMTNQQMPGRIAGPEFVALEQWLVPDPFVQTPKQLAGRSCAGCSLHPGGRPTNKGEHPDDVASQTWQHHGRAICGVWQPNHRLAL